MTHLTIHHIDPTLKTSLRLRATAHGCSIEEEARQILHQALLVSPDHEGLGSRIHRRFAAVGGIELPEIPRTFARPAPDLSESNDLA